MYKKREDLVVTKSAAAITPTTSPSTAQNYKRPLRFNNTKRITCMRNTYVYGRRIHSQSTKHSDTHTRTQSIYNCMVQCNSVEYIDVSMDGWLVGRLVGWLVE